ncbi:class I adenylate-forming enzyme family protein [Rhodococcus opacus]|uniref:class I adenylate-forming enzyme family protein n=1 Tax=Rhodococcus opacus TaxID=37919 RepID=UPI0029496D99|nr:AMP-binding protein [Rhodococcus opacus]MDV6247187.1 AMP-binding protein [Rhodococcus opacus]
MATFSTPATPVRDLISPLYVEYADRVAFRFRDESVTFAELGARALRIANSLRARGLQEGDRVVVIGDNSIEWVLLEHALYAGGFVRVAVLTRLHPKEVARLVADAEASAAVVDSAWLEKAGRDWVPESVQHLFVFGEPIADTTSFAELEESGNDSPVLAVDPDALSWIAYTSGSTGLPKGVMHTQRSLGAFLRNAVAELGPMTAEDVALHSAPLSHFSGVIELAVTIGGGTNLLHPSFNAEAVIDAIENDGVTILPLVPTQITMLTDALRARSRAGRSVDLGRVRLVPYAGSAIAPDRLGLALNFFGGTLMQFYGAQEAPMPLTCLRPEDHVSGDTSRLASAGRKTRHVELKIIGVDGAEVATGEVGEICARGENVTKGYWNNPAATAEVLRTDGWLHTGDMGYLDGEGFLFIVDRKKDMIVTGGFNVYPREVENTISTLAGVREVAVVGAPSERWGEEITAVVSVEPDASLSEDDVIAHCQTAIAGYKAPKRVLFVDELPKTGTGKIQKVDIRADLWQGLARRV